MTNQTRLTEKDHQLIFQRFFQERYNISEIARQMSISRSTVRRSLSQRGYVPIVFTQAHAHLLTELKKQGIESVCDLRSKLIKPTLETIEERLATLTPNEWGPLLYRASVKRHLLIKQFYPDLTVTGDVDG